MASAMMSREESVSPKTVSRDVTPHTSEHEGMMKKSNGYIASPLRASHRISSIATNKELPDVPQEEVGAGSFPFSAQPGSLGPAPTTSQIVNGTSKRESTTATAPARNRTNASGTATPPERRSVQFARSTTNEEAAPPPAAFTREAEEDGDDTPMKERQGSFFGKLRALASSSGSSGHLRHASSAAGSGTPTHTALSPQSERSEHSDAVEPGESGEDDAEEEMESGHESDAVEHMEIRPKRRRQSQRPRFHPAESASSTPKTGRFESRFASFMRDQSGSHDAKTPSSNRPSRRLGRRNTMSDASDEHETHAGVSEDEGRDRVRTAWRKGIEGARGLSYAARRNNENESPDTRRPSHLHLRRITGLGGGTSNLDGNPSSPFRMKADRQASASAQKWRQVKAGLKMLGQRRRDERTRVDHQKSAQLMAELLAGAPAALVFASMFQRDEHNHRKIPVLLEQLKIRVLDSHIRKEKSGDRHLVFKVDLEYGNGPSRMKWTISRSLKDFVNLHAKYQAQAAADKVRHLTGGENKNRAKMPRFPRSAFPFARSFRGLFDNLADEESEDEAETNAPLTPGGAMFTPGLPELEGVAEDPTTPGTAGPMTPGMGSSSVHTPGVGPSAAAKHKRRKSSVFAPMTVRRTSTSDLGPLPNDPEELDARQRELYQKRQRRKLETYLQKMIRWLIFRPDSTRLCKFLELSALAIRLSAEGGFQGKQGLLTIASRRNRELRRKPIGPQAIAERHRPRWFLVRHSYIVCVDGPESLNPYDVFLVDSSFSTEKRKKRVLEQNNAVDVAKAVAERGSHPKHLMLRLYNSERKLKLLARTERQYLQFQESIDLMAEATIWSRKQRFSSYAPVRNKVWCRWLVDGRDHMWQVSRAIDNAKDFVYIHDWWLSPELYMRRPAAISQKWRLDRLLQRKATEGVKIFVIVYRNIESAIPIDSEYTKWSLLDLHPNICIQRSPNQFRQNQFFWAHHEKLVVVDNMMAFVGGVDLCFGRWDDPCHGLTDDKYTGFELAHDGPRDSEHCQVWPGKDYSNPRVQDFYALDRPYEEMYDRTKVPRMPWHDIAMQMVGQPARDVGRHFVQRWNYILRSRIPSRPTPVLIPPPEYEQMELENLGMTGSCQVQILRSCSQWSIGTPGKVEHSIMNAYVHLIQHSQHFVYIENQFYISSCMVEGTTIHNKIGDALVERIIRAYENDEHWGACIVIPLMPGFQNSVDSQDGTSIRLIMQCQYRSICRGDSSIFGCLKERGIEPEDYIRFYSLRQWGKIGPRKSLTTEQLYIHAKCMVVDDRSAIIGSANINERSMLGSRDSEVAAVVTDMRMLPSFMGGEPYEVGEFPHTLRKRLMREHLGVDVDAIYRREQAAREREEQDAEMTRIYREDDHVHALDQEEPADYFSGAPVPAASHMPLTQGNLEVSSASAAASSGLGGATRVGSAVSLGQVSEHQRMNEKNRTTLMEFKHDQDVDGMGPDGMKELADAGVIGLTDSFVNALGHEVLLKKEAPDAKRLRALHGIEQEKEEEREKDRRKVEEQPPIKPPYPTERMDTYSLGLLPRSQLPELPPLDDTDIGGPALIRGESQISGAGIKFVNPLFHTLRRPEVHEDCMTDPLISTFYHDIWHHVAENNTKIYRQVFRCMPDSEVTDWKSYEKFNEYHDRFMQSQGLGSSKPMPAKDAPEKSGPPGSGGTERANSAVGSVSEKVAVATAEGRARSKSALSGWVDKMRPGSRMSDVPATHTGEMREKDENSSASKNMAGAPPASPISGTSSVPTAVPSPRPEPLDEKEAQKAVDQALEQGQVKPTTPTDAQVDEKQGTKEEDFAAVARHRTVQYSENLNSAPEITATQTTASSGAAVASSGSQKRRRRGTTKSSARQLPEEVLGREEAEELLKLVQGHLVLWPYEWLEKEERGGNWLYNIDQLAPLEIYD
ncbi:Phospholipase D1 [Vermiconidia calcicola]|uniref:Phospholipase D1 n=1 Tax=Vermiconidia calcicola TaxID=1690605 RepID=A0ACC3NN37_9PEZI|nr:Phospholipase D1 [Vermiconidia calcicola]